MQPSKTTLGGIRRGGLWRPFGREATAFESSFPNSTSPQAFRLRGTSLRLPRTIEVYPTPPIGQGFANLRKVSLAPRKFRSGKSLFLSLTKRVDLNQAHLRNPIRFAKRSARKNQKGQ